MLAVRGDIPVTLYTLNQSYTFMQEDYAENYDGILDQIYAISKGWAK